MKVNSHMFHPQTQSQHFNMGRGLAALGRGEDSTLVHMSNKEVNGLQHLAMAHGGSLTINPHTGLPEAGFLSSILPDIAGAALTIGTGGAVAPLEAGLLVGGADALITKNWKDGLAAGLGAYGGASISGSLAGIGSQAAKTAAQAASPIATTTSVGADLPNAAVGETVSGAGQGASGVGIGSATTTALPAAPAATVPSSASDMWSNVQAGAQQLGSKQGWKDLYAGSGKLGLGALAAPALYNSYQSGLQANIPTSPHGTYYGMKYHPGTQNPYQGPGQTPLIGQGYSDPTAIGTYARGGSIKRFAPGGITAPSLPVPNGPPQGTTVPASQFAASPANSQGVASQAPPSQLAQYYQSLMNAPPQQAPQGNYAPPQVSNPNAIQKTNPAPSTNPTSNTWQGYMNNLNKYLEPTAQTAAVSKPVGTAAPAVTTGDGTTVPTYNPNTQTYNTPGQGNSGGLTNYDLYNLQKLRDSQTGFGMASGGLTSLGSYSDGGRMLKGPGDGMSDSIPATIQGPQPQKAALADGEFVVPADVVSHLGNGSTDAGSKKLYSMLDKVRMARTGKKAQGRQINPDRYMPT